MNKIDKFLGDSDQHWEGFRDKYGKIAEDSKHLDNSIYASFTTVIQRILIVFLDKVKSITGSWDTTVEFKKSSTALSIEKL